MYLFADYAEGIVDNDFQRGLGLIAGEGENKSFIVRKITIWLELLEAISKLD